METTVDYDNDELIFQFKIDLIVWKRIHSKVFDKVYNGLKQT